MNTRRVFDNQKMLALRRSRKLTQFQLADLLGMPQSRVSDLERNGGDIKTRTLSNLCNALGCTPNDLLPLKNPPENNSQTADNPLDII